ncbi:MAG: hypothetical protein ACD_19C00014G0017 [uncultured bacterium]|nr:MAG: hypothetical protein ACD_19C00014G0017 [uncultured bacterium]
MNNLLLAANDVFDLNSNIGSIGNTAKQLSLGGMVSGFISLILILAGLAFFFILVVGGVKWILSGGDKAHTEGARNQITAALVGLVIVFSAWAIAGLIDSFFGINILNLKIESIVGK